MGYFNGDNLDRFLSEISRVSRADAKVVIRVGRFVNNFYIYFLKFLKGKESKIYVANNFSKHFLKKIFSKHGFDSTFCLSREYSGPFWKRVVFFCFVFFRSLLDCFK